MVTELNLKEIKKTGLICHQVNCQGVMGAGIAKVIADIFPYSKEEYLKLCQSIPIEHRLGIAQFVMVEPKLFVGHIFGQYNYGRNRRQTDYDSLKEGLQQVKRFVEKKQDSKTCVNCDYTRYKELKICPRCKDDRSVNIGEFPVYIPYKMGCGLAGGDWDIVGKMVNDILPNAIIFKHKEN